jgi:gluconolactonase
MLEFDAYPQFRRTSKNTTGSSNCRRSFGDIFTTNVCFGGHDMRTAYVTLSQSGVLAKAPWPAAGLRLAFNG